MIADRKWVHRNIGFDPIARPAPRSTFAVAAAAKRAASTEDLEREIIDFDSEAPEGLAFLAFPTATGLSRFNDIRRPKGLEPKPDSSPCKGNNGELPTADVGRDMDSERTARVESCFPGTFSDPQIKAEGTWRDQAQLAAQIYKGFGRWSTVCSSIAAGRSSRHSK